MKKFLLISDNTAFQFTRSRYLGPYRIAYELEKSGVQTYVLDFFYDFPNFFEFLENFLDEDFVGVGISTTFLTPLEEDRSLQKVWNRRLRNEIFRDYFDSGIISKDPNVRRNWFKTLREILNRKSPAARIFAGGSKAQFLYRSEYESIEEIDYVVMGVVDSIFPRVIQDYIETGSVNYKLMGNKKVVDTKFSYKQPKVCPRHEWLPHWNIQAGEALPIEIGRGCAFNCKFCNYDKRENTLKNLEDLKFELISNFENYGVQYYHFVDDCFNDSRKKVEEVCNLILQLPFKIEWVSYLRFDVAVKFPETADLIVESGGRGFHWGVESLTAEVARRAGKGTPPDAIKDFIIQFAKKYRGKCYSAGSLISGLPGETEESWSSQMDWLLNTDNFDFLHIGPLGISSYQAEFDGTVIDYADYSRNPEKYGFEEIDFERGYWRHKTMDQTKASELAMIANQKIDEKNRHRKGLSSGIWVYPILKSLGYSDLEVNDLYFCTDLKRQGELIQKAGPVYRSRMQNYFQSMKDLKKQSRTMQMSITRNELI